MPDSSGGGSSGGGGGTVGNLTAGAGLVGGGDLSTDQTVDIVANADGSIVINPNDIQVGILATDSQHGNRGGGNLHTLVASGGSPGFMSVADKIKLDALSDPASPITLTAGAGLTGGGVLSTDRTIAIGTNADGSITVNADDIQVGILATDAQHGNRGNGSLHTVAVASGNAGFMSGTDKALLSYLSTDYTRSAINLTAGAGLTGGGNLTADRTFNVIAHSDASIVVNPDNIQVGVLATDAQHGTRGGGTIHSTVVSSGNAGFMSGTDKAILDYVYADYTRSAVNLTAGAGLTGGGNLTASRTFNIVAADSSITVNADSIQVGALSSDSQHGNLGGGSLHAAVTTSTNGFMVAADKAKVDQIITLNSSGQCAIANSSAAAGTNGVAIGKSASASGNFSTAVGEAATATVTSAASFGSSAHATATNATAIGPASSVNSTGGTALGPNATVTATSGTALGDTCTVSGNYGIALGAVAKAGLNELVIGSATGLIDSAKIITTASTRDILTERPFIKFSGAHLGAASGSTTSYLADQGASASALVLTVRPQLPIPGRTVRNLRVKCPSNPLGSGLTVTVLKNGGATSIEVTVTTGSTALFSDTTHTAAFSAGDELDIRMVSVSAGAVTATIVATLEIGI